MSLSLIAGAALAENAFGRVLQMGAADNTVILATAATQTPVGIVGAAPVAAGEAFPVVPLNGAIGKVRSGGTITRGQLLIAAADGEVTGVANQAALAADVTAVGVALEGGVDGQIIRALLMPLTSSTET